MILAVNSLSELISEYAKDKDLSNKLFIFCSKTKRNIRIIELNCDGHQLYQKKLIKGKFQWAKKKRMHDFDRKKIVATPFRRTFFTDKK